MMKKINRLIVGASIVASMSAIAPAQAAAIQNATITGNAPYLTYDADATSTFLVPNSANNVQKVLGGDSSSPTGNVELFSNSEKLSYNQFTSYSATTSLAGTIGGKAITLSSLTFADWNSDFGGQTLAQKWFGDLLAANNLTSVLGANTPNEVLASFIDNGGLQRFSDPNISYVNQDQNGLIRIGLAGHFNAVSLIQAALQPTQAQLQATYNKAQTALSTAEAGLSTLQKNRNLLLAQLAIASSNQKPAIQLQITTLTGQINAVQIQIDTIKQQISQISTKLNPLTALLNNKDLSIQASELVKVSYDNGPAQYLYSFKATNSGLVNREDRASHNGNYEVKLQGDKPSQSVPEPSAVIGLVSLGGLLAAKRKLTKPTSAS